MGYLNRAVIYPLVHLSVFGCPTRIFFSAFFRAALLLHPGRRRLLDSHFSLGVGSLGAWREPLRRAREMRPSRP